jgi:hypothetical protein
MHHLKHVIVFSILFLSLICSAQEQDGSVLDTKVTIIEENQPLSFILDQLSWQAGVYFSYNASLIDATKKYTVDAANKSLFTVLNQLFDARKFRFSELQNQIIISVKKEIKQETPSVNDSIPVKYFFLKGKIIENKKEKPIPYASVSIFKKPVGTISNNDGDFLLKIHPNNILDTIIVSCMGFEQILLPAYKILDEDVLEMNPISIRIKEVKVSATTPEQLLKNIRANFKTNYSNNTELLTAFYRETIKQDQQYISASEAVLEILKSPYLNTFRNDLVRLLKGRRSPDTKPFQWFNFKLQGGPFTITQLDVVKTMESFIDEKYENLYSYSISKVIWYNNNPVYVLTFKPVSNLVFPSFDGEMYVHRETFAIVYAHFKFNKNNLRKAESIMIKRKPRGVKARPTFVEYKVNYQHYKGVWQLAGAQASVKFRVRSKRDKINSTYHSVSDLLVTNILTTDLKRFTKNETFKQRDIFVEMLDNYDEKFWENYNIIKPDEDLQNAFKAKLFSNE